MLKALPIHSVALNVHRHSPSAWGLLPEKLWNQITQHVPTGVCSFWLRAWHGFQLTPEGSRICFAPKHPQALELRAYPRPTPSETFLEASSNPSGQVPRHNDLARPPKILV